MRISGRSRSFRCSLLLTSAIAACAAVPALGQSRPSEVIDAAQSTRPTEVFDQAQGARPTDVVDSAQALVSLPGQDQPQVTINNNFTPTDVRDPTNITGIGQLVTDAGGGSVGLCTATLINPRTVIFAAHCVNTRAATAYGASTGGTGIAIGFETNTRANAAGQPDELVNWLTGGSTGPGRFKTNTAQALYNINQVFWNPASTAAASCTGPTSCFLEGDIATAVLDTPTRNIPTWTMLFSPLATPASINPATGTGYHVTISGYGQNGTGTTGVTGSDFRRRTAENMLGALTSINARNLFLFGTTGSPSRPQLLYWLDFDDPARGTAAANARDFNGFRDNALPREGITGPGDSGGPLILDQTFSRSTILGVLSGGSTFFAGQPQSSYGTQSFYQPLFLYWDWIVANNPYRYVASLAGNKNWEDPTAWVTTLDPAYQIISGGQLVNGLPTQLGGTNVATTPQFGEVCFQSPLNGTPITTNECQNLTTGAARNNVPNTPTGTSDSSSPLTAALLSSPDTVALDIAMGAATGLDGAIESPQADPGYRDGALAAPSLANGLPGATNFVPNNNDGVRATGVAARYYDVTMSAAGTITLNSTVTVDRYTIAGAQSQLTVTAGSLLTSLIDFNHVTGIINNNGTITSGGDYFFMSGLLTGSGTVRAPFVTSVLGNFAPGTLGTVGQQAFVGNLTLASGSTYAVDLGANLVSDRISVVSAGTGATDGAANVGGRVLISRVAGQTIRANDTFTILTAQNGVTGQFIAPSAISALLTPTLFYTSNSVQVRLVSGSYADAIVRTSPVQAAYAHLFDTNRGIGQFSTLYDFLDLQDAATIRSTFEALAPRTETLRTALATASVENNDILIRDRLTNLEYGSLGGTMSYIGRPVQTAQAALVAMPGQQLVQSDAGGSEATTTREGALPDTMSGFIAGGYLNGDSAPMPTAIPAGGRDRFNGWYLAGGLEFEVGDNAVGGVALSYTDLDGTTVAGAQTVRGSLVEGSLYGKTSLGGLTLDARLSAGALSTRSLRGATVGATTYTLEAKDSSLVVTSEVGLSKLWGDKIQFGPRIAGRASHIGYSRILETGGGPALSIERNPFNSVQGRAGIVVKTTGKIRAYATATYVHDFMDTPAVFGGSFAGGSSATAIFALAGQDQDWVEISGGLAVDTGRIVLSVGADTTIDRQDVTKQSYRGAIKLRF